MVMDHPLPEFPHPTRPEFAPYPDPDPQFSQQFHLPDILELPKRSRTVSFQTQDCDPVRPCPPYSSSESTVDDVSTNPEAVEAPEAAEEGGVRLSPATGRTPKGEREAVDELLSILVECMDGLNTRSRELLLRKFFAELEREERLEKFIVERLKQSRVKAISDMCNQISASREESDIDKEMFTTDTDVDDLILARSISESVEELSLKLERFKVRTVDVGQTIVKEEEDAKR